MVLVLRRPPDLSRSSGGEVCTSLFHAQFFAVLQAEHEPSPGFCAAPLLSCTALHGTAQHSTAQHGMAVGFPCSEAARTLHSIQDTSCKKAEVRARAVPHIKDMTPFFSQPPAQHWAVLCPISHAAAGACLAIEPRLLISKTTCQTSSDTS